MAFEAEGPDRDLQGVEEVLGEVLEGVLVDGVDSEVEKDLFSTAQDLLSKKNSTKISK